VCPGCCRHGAVAAACAGLCTYGFPIPRPGVALYHLPWGGMHHTQVLYMGCTCSSAALFDSPGFRASCTCGSSTIVQSCKIWICTHTYCTCFPEVCTEMANQAWLVLGCCRVCYICLDQDNCVLCICLAQNGGLAANWANTGQSALGMLQPHVVCWRQQHRGQGGVGLRGLCVNLVSGRQQWAAWQCCGGAVACWQRHHECGCLRSVGWGVVISRLLGFGIGGFIRRQQTLNEPLAHMGDVRIAEIGLYAMAFISYY
jgi:hypothetical protein